MVVEKRNIFLKKTESILGYTARSQNGGDPNYPVRHNINNHGEFIRRRLNDSYQLSTEQKQAAAIRYKAGVYLEFSSAVGFDLALESLENKAQGIRLLNVRNEIDNEVVKATVYVPEGKENYFLKKLNAYLTEKSDKGKPKNNNLISSIDDISLAMLESFWTGKVDDMPNQEKSWCEVWLRFDDSIDPEKRDLNIKSTILNLVQSCELLEIQIDEKHLVFPERLVKLVQANRSQLMQLINVCEYIAEIRRAPEEASFFDDLTGTEQQEWIDELLGRTEFNDGNATVCILDTGLNSSHPLLSPAVPNENVIQAVEESWGPQDHEGHGTEMAGVALYYDLKDKLTSGDFMEINHKLESVKILPPRGSNSPELYGAVTENAIYLSEIENPTAERTFCMAITAPDFNTEDGSPTSWSAAIDSVTSGAAEENSKRLFFISAGNVQPDEIKNSPYPDVNILHSVENPGQSWNAITVGAYCNDINVSSPSYRGFKPVADVGELSPYSSTSKTWSDKWPIKPEILLNGGNMVTNNSDYLECEDLSLLTTGKNYTTKPLSIIWGTSSATAQASWMAAQIFNEYPGIWPETVRALLIHSASWPEKMVKQLRKDHKKTSGIKQLLRTCGYGIPNLNKALECANNSVNMIIQSEIQPFTKNKKMKDMHIHKIPWPKEVLQSLGEINAKLKVTLSYFVEPGPGEIGWKNKYRYPSCGLRFDVINSNETLEDFQKRVNVQMRGEDKKDKGEGSSREWFLGKNNRDVGSIHSDFCEVPAVDLCDTQYIAVYPVVGWWRERSYLGKGERKVRYSLVVSIETPENDTDLYTPILTQIDISQEVEIMI